MVHNDAVPFYEELGLTISAVLTDNGTEFCGTPEHPYEIYLVLSGVEHRTTKVRSSQTNGLVECFQRTVSEEFFARTFRTKLYKSVEALQTDLNA